MARMVFGRVANEAAPPRAEHFRRSATETLCGLRITGRMVTWGGPGREKMVTCKHCLRVLSEEARP